MAANVGLNVICVDVDAQPVGVQHFLQGTHARTVRARKHAQSGLYRSHRVATAPLGIDAVRFAAVLVAHQAVASRRLSLNLAPILTFTGL